ncbi:MAG: diaminopimelate epimerase [Halothiobacillaceae bacterium]
MRNFTKMHGLGNDFMVIDATESAFAANPERIRALADRHFGVGFDQLLVVEKPASAQALFRYRIFNADGSEVEQCGNGARCFARFVRDRGLTAAREIPVETLGGLITLRIEDGDRVTVDMGAPRFAPTDLPFEAEADQPAHTLKIHPGGLPVTVEIGVVSMGNPHAVLVVPDIVSAPVAEWGPLIEAHERFPRRVNAGFMQVLSRGRIRLRVYERGAGETLACGTGACAAVATGIRRGLLDDRVRVSLPGGDLDIRRRHTDGHLLMTGPAVTVFEGRLAEPD